MAVSLEERIKNQVEFYLGDSNFARDKFFQEEAAKNEEGWIDMRVLLRCNRLKELTEDGTKVAESLQDSDIVEVSDDGKALRRKHSLVDDIKQKLRARTVFAKPFSSGANFEQIGECFKQFGDIKSVRIRRVQGKSIGEAFVEFASAEQANKAAEAEQLCVEGAPLADDGKKVTLEVIMFHEWHSSASKRPRVEIDDESGNAPSSSSSSSSNSAAANNDADIQVEYTPGMVISAQLADEPEPEPELHFGHVKDVLKEFNVQFVELDGKRALARLDAPTAADVAATLTERQVAICGVPTVFTALCGDEEREYYIRAEKMRQQKRSQPRHKKRRRK
jgi:La domain/RNA recognition motif/RNA binding motif